MRCDAARSARGRGRCTRAWRFGGVCVGGSGVQRVRIKTASWIASRPGRHRHARPCWLVAEGRVSVRGIRFPGMGRGGARFVPEAGG